jgi:hypothetical protein
MKQAVKDLVLLSVMSVMFVSTFFLFMMLLVGMLNGGITEQYDLNHYGEGWIEVCLLAIGLVGSPCVIHDYINNGGKTK